MMRRRGPAHLVAYLNGCPCSWCHRLERLVEERKITVTSPEASR